MGFETLQTTFRLYFLCFLSQFYSLELNVLIHLHYSLLKPHLISGLYSFYRPELEKQLVKSQINNLATSSPLQHALPLHYWGFANFYSQVNVYDPTLHYQLYTPTLLGFIPFIRLAHFQYSLLIYPLNSGFSTFIVSG